MENKKFEVYVEDFKKLDSIIAEKGPFWAEEKIFQSPTFQGLSEGFKFILGVSPPFVFPSLDTFWNDFWQFLRESGKMNTRECYTQNPLSHWGSLHWGAQIFADEVLSRLSSHSLIGKTPRLLTAAASTHLCHVPSVKDDMAVTGFLDRRLPMIDPSNFDPSNLFSFFEVEYLQWHARR